MKFVYADNAVGRESVAKSVKQEFNRKVRFAATNYQTMIFFIQLLFSKNLLVSYAFWSHKVIRWFVPQILLIIFLLSLIYFHENSTVKFLLYLQSFFYLFSLIGFVLSLLKIRLKIFSLPNFFMISNIALAVGFIKFLFKKNSVVWETTVR